MFQKKAIGKFLISVPIQTAGSFVTGIPSIMILYRIEATRLIAGHMTAIVPARITVLCGKSRSRPVSD